MTRVDTNVVLRGDDINGAFALSAPAMTVNPGALDSFTFTTQPNPTEKILSTIFIDVNSQDQFDNNWSFNFTATISDITGTIFESPTPGDNQIDFVAGQYSGNVVISKPQLNNVIVVTFGSVSSSSNTFDVIANNIFVRLDNDIAPKVAFEGDVIEMFDVELANPDSVDPVRLANSTINTNSALEFFVESSQSGITSTANPATLISKLSVFDVTSGTPSLIGETTTIPNNTTTSIAINIPPTTNVDIAPSSSLIIRVGVTLKTDISQAAIPNLLLRVGDISGNFLDVPQTIIDPTNDNFESIKDPANFIRSGITNVRELAKAAFNFPNPFNPRKQLTTIAFFSPSTGQTTIKIFTITGRLVRTLKGSTVVGSNEIVWDGKNGRGQVVRNGVYVAIIMPPGGSKQTVKIAVVK